MKMLHVKCPKCRYEEKLVVGEPSMTQTFSDLNEDYSRYELFECSACKVIESHNIQNKRFKGKCTSCGGSLKKIPKADYRNLSCPKCRAELSESHVEM